MVLGMSLQTFTAIHVVISLIGIAAGLIVMYGLLTGKAMNGMTALFLVTTVLTSVNGFGFPVEHLLPSHKAGIISLVLLAIAIPGRSVFRMAGVWRWVYVIGAMMALYLNAFVGVVQSFLKIPGLHALAPRVLDRPSGSLNLSFC